MQSRNAPTKLGAMPQGGRRAGAGRKIAASAFAWAGVAALLSVPGCLQSLGDLHPQTCPPGAQEACFDDPARPSCQTGTRTCSADGATWSACEGLSCGKAEWIAHFGSPDGYAQAASLAVDTDGSILVAGQFSGTLPFGATTLKAVGPEDIFLARLDPAGNPLWIEQFGNASDQGYHPIVAVDPHGVAVLAGAFAGDLSFGGATLSADGYDAFVATFDRSGQPLESRAFGGPGDQLATTIVLDGAGNLVVGGAYNGTLDLGNGALVDPGAGLFNGFAAKLHGLTGNAEWSYPWVTVPTDRANYTIVALGPSDSVVVTGSYGGPVGFAGASASTCESCQAIFTVALDSRGNVAWSQSSEAVGSAVHVPFAIAVDADGDVVMSGYYQAGGFGLGSLDPFPPSPVGAQQVFFLAKLGGGDGAPQWMSNAVQSGDVSPVALTVGAQKEIWTAGAVITGSIDFGMGAVGSNGSSYLARFDPTGKVLWSEAGSGSPGSALSLQALAIDPVSGQLVLAGGVARTVELGNRVVSATSLNQWDLLVAKLAP